MSKQIVTTIIQSNSREDLTNRIDTYISIKFKEKHEFIDIKYAVSNGMYSGLIIMSKEKIKYANEEIKN